MHDLYFQACVQNSSYALVLWFLNLCFEFPFNFGFGIFCLCTVVAAVAWCQIPAFINACCATVQESKAAEYRFSYRKYTQRKNTNTKKQIQIRNEKRIVLEIAVKQDDNKTQSSSKPQKTVKHKIQNSQVFSLDLYK